MGASPEQLEREITQTREELGRTLGRIEERLSPRRVLRERPWLVVVGLGLLGGLAGWYSGRHTGGD